MRTTDTQLQEFLKAKDAYMKSSYKVYLNENSSRHLPNLWDKEKEVKSLLESK